MNTAPALRIVATRKSAASAVGTTPRKKIASIGRGAAGPGIPSTISIAGISAAAPTLSNRAVIVIGSMGGQRRVITLDTA